MKKKVKIKEFTAVFKKDRREKRHEGRQYFYDDVRINLKRTSFHDKIIAFLKLGLLFVLSIGVPVLIYTLNKDMVSQFSSVEDLERFLENYKGATYLALMGIQALQIIISVIPGQPIQLVSSYLYGFWNGYLISIAGALVGTIFTYYMSRFLGKDALHILFGEKRVTEYIKKLNSGKAYAVIILIYLIPGIPKDIMCYVAGISEIKLIPFLIISTLGRTPGIMGSLLIGSLLDNQNYLGLIILIAVTILIFYIFIRNRKKLIELVDKLESHDK